MSRPVLPPRFEPHAIEARWQAHWAEGAYFRAPDRPRGTPFVVPHPPPNVTGTLTMGHMLGDTIRDTLVRWHRMRGEPTLWFLGIDHAGLATQVEVRRRLAKQGIRLESLPREEVLAHVEAWKREHESHILQQLRAGGFSVDWSRYRYTMDPAAIRATREVFVRLYDEGLIYRGERIVNWDPVLRTAISDLEVKHTEEPAELLYVTYPWADGSAGGLVVATVRPETIFGDIAVAVHPADERHRAEVGRSVRVPLTDRTVPVVADAAVDPTFGNGALKLTPRHDPLDFEIFRRQEGLALPPSVLSPTGHLEGEAVPERFRGLDRDRARAEVTEALRAAGRVARTERIVHSVGRSERSDAVVEPMLLTQWFVRMGPLAEPAIRAVRDGEVRFHPERWNLTFFRWMESLEDWCISRQVVWGHRVPVYYCDACRAPTAAVEPPAACPKCGGRQLTADPDVLDTWFTSWLWPFLALGWPEATADLAAYYPASVLVTGRDIMFFWVARMMMAGYHFTGRAPFADVYFTGMLRDAQGRRMSKHLGNSPDPLDIVRTWGADTMRFALLFPNPVDQDGAFGNATLEGSRNFLTKLWNLVRFTLGHLPEGAAERAAAPRLTEASALENRWILSRWSRTAHDLDAALAAFELTRAAGLLYQFLWHDVADAYVEIAKDALASARGPAAQRESRETLRFVLDRTLAQLHPMVPHVTEELWHALPHSGDALAVAPWPDPAEAVPDPAAETEMETVLDAIRTLRNLRAESHVPVSEVPAALVRPDAAGTDRILAAQETAVLRLARVRELRRLAPGADPPPRVARAVTARGEFFVELTGAAGGAEAETLRRERERLVGLLAKAQARIGDAGFLSRAPAEVVREAESRARELAERLARIDQHLAEVPAGEGSG